MEAGKSIQQKRILLWKMSFIQYQANENNFSKYIVSMHVAIGFFFVSFDRMLSIKMDQLNICFQCNDRHNVIKIVVLEYWKMCLTKS